MPILVKRADGSSTPYKNAEYIPAFLMIPKELLIRCGMEMFMLPRTRAGLFADPGTIRKVESNLFEECVIDTYAYMAWPHMGLKGRLEDYSGYNPCWKVAHAPSLWIMNSQTAGSFPLSSNGCRKQNRILTDITCSCRMRSWMHTFRSSCRASCSGMGIGSG